YLDEYKLHPQVRNLLAAAANHEAPGSALFSVQLVIDQQANSATLQLIEQLKTEPIKKRARVLGYLNVVVGLPIQRLNEIAERPEVVSIHPWVQPIKTDERQDQIMAANL